MDELGSVNDAETIDEIINQAWDYASLRKRMFGRETTDTLYKKVKRFEDLYK